MSSKDLKNKISYGWKLMSGLGITREQFMGMVGSVMGESGRLLNTSAFNPNDPEGGAFGMFQHVGSRRRELEKFAKATGRKATDYRAQWEFVHKELQTTEKKALEAIKSTRNRREASLAWTRKFERPAEKTANHAGRAANADFAHKVMFGENGKNTGDEMLMGDEGGDGLGGTTGGDPYDVGITNDPNGNGLNAIGSLLGLDVGTADELGPMTPTQGIAMALGGLVGGPSGIKLAGQLFGTSESTPATPLTGPQAIAMSIGGLLGGIPGAALGQSIAGLWGPKADATPAQTQQPAAQQGGSSGGGTSGGGGFLGGISNAFSGLSGGHVDSPRTVTGGDR